MNISDHINKYFIKLNNNKRDIIIENCNKNIYYRHFIKSIIKFRLNIIKNNKLISKKDLINLCDKYKISLIRGLGSKIVKISKEHDKTCIDKVKNNYKQFNINIKNLDKLVDIINMIYDENNFFDKIYDTKVKNKINLEIENYNKNLKFIGNNTLSLDHLKNLNISDSDSEFDINSIYIAEYSNR